jgi:hypothetical protein
MYLEGSRKPALNFLGPDRVEGGQKKETQKKKKKKKKRKKK